MDEVMEINEKSFENFWILPKFKNLNKKSNLNFRNFAGGEYRYMPYSIPPTPFCDLLKSDIYFYEDLTKSSDLPKDIKNNCPIVPVSFIVFLPFLH
jgi:hypothetical protein